MVDCWIRHGAVTKPQLESQIMEASNISFFYRDSRLSQHDIDDITPVLDLAHLRIAA